MSDFFTETEPTESAATQETATPAQSFGMRLVDHFREAAAGAVSQAWSLTREFASAAYDTGMAAVQALKSGFEGMSNGMDARTAVPVPVKAGPSP